MEENDYYVQIKNGEETVASSLDGNLKAEDINSSTSLVLHYNNTDHNYSLKVDKNGGLVGLNSNDNLSRAETIDALGGQDNYYSLLSSQGISLPKEVKAVDAAKIVVDGKEITPTFAIYDNGEIFVDGLNYQLTEEQIKAHWPETYKIINPDSIQSVLEGSTEGAFEVSTSPSDHGTRQHATSHNTGGSGGRTSSTTTNTGDKTKDSKTVSVNYDGVISRVNDIVSSINSTSFINDKNTNNQGGKASIVDAINAGDNYLKNVSSNLLSQISMGANNVGTLLTNYAKQDADLAKLSAQLNLSLSGGNVGGASATYEAGNIKSFQSIVAQNTTFYDEKIQVGKAGKITLNDFKSNIASKLTSLDNEIKDAGNLKKSLGNLINSPDIQGEGWDALKGLLNKYDECNDVRIKAAETLIDAYKEAEKIITEYMDPYEDLDDSEIPDYEDKVTELDSEIKKQEGVISTLEAENQTLAGVNPEAIYDFTEEGKRYFSHWDYTEYNKAQAKISSNITLIKDAEGLLEIAKNALEETKKYLDKLKGLAEVMSEANKVINDAMTEIEYMYAKEVYGVDTPRLQSLRGDDGIVVNGKQLEGGNVVVDDTGVPWYTDSNGKKLHKVYDVLGDNLIGVAKNIVATGNPQGLAEFGNYIVSTNSSGTVYIYDKTTGERKNVFIDKDSHLGGIAYKDGYLYVANNSNITRYDFNQMLNGNLVSKDYASRKTTNNPKTDQVSFLTITDDGKLITGQFHMAGNQKYDRGGSASDLLVYDIDSNGDLVSKGTIKVPQNMTKIQGACVYKKNGQDYYLLTSSYGTNNNATSKLYVATLNSKGTELVPRKSIKLPAGAEQVTVTSDGKIAVVYEGQSAKNNITVLDPNKVINI